jgi:serine/threonine protein kinase
VAVKEIKNASLENNTIEEARILHRLRHPNIPLLVGVCFDQYPYLIVTTYHSIENGFTSQSTTLFNALDLNTVGCDLRPHWLGILHDLSTAVSYVHGQNIIHNDIKSNNAVVEKQGENYSAVLIDFGKATAVNDGKIYPEFDDAEEEKYQRKFPYLAPELKAGGGRQSEASDVYSFGYLMKVVSHTINDRELSTLYHMCKDVSPTKRPKMTEVEEALKKLKY